MQIPKDGDLPAESAREIRSTMLHQSEVEFNFKNSINETGENNRVSSKPAMSLQKEMPEALNNNLINNSNSVKKDSIPNQAALVVHKLPDGFDMTFMMSELQNQENFILVDLLKQLGDYPITLIADKQGLTLLHHAVLKGVEGKTKLLIDFARNFQKLNEDDIMKWLNMKTTGEGWTALHYGSF